MSEVRFDDINRLDGSNRQNADERVQFHLVCPGPERCRRRRGGRSAAYYLVCTVGGWDAMFSLTHSCPHSQSPGLPPPCRRAYAVARLFLFSSRYYSSNPGFTLLPCLATPVFLSRTLPPSYFHLHLPPTCSYGGGLKRSAVPQGSCLPVYLVCPVCLWLLCPSRTGVVSGVCAYAYVWCARACV